MQAPWYYGVDAATLKHQRVQPETMKPLSEVGAWYKRGVKQVFSKLVYLVHVYKKIHS